MAIVLRGRLGSLFLWLSAQFTFRGILLSECIVLIALHVYFFRDSSFFIPIVFINLMYIGLVFRNTSPAAMFGWTISLFWLLCFAIWFFGLILTLIADRETTTETNNINILPSSLINMIFALCQNCHFTRIAQDMEIKNSTNANVRENANQNALVEIEAAAIPDVEGRNIEVDDVINAAAGEDASYDNLEEFNAIAMSEAVSQDMENGNVINAAAGEDANQKALEDVDATPPTPKDSLC